VKTIAKTLPITLPKRPKTLFPDVGLILIAIETEAHTTRCSMKNRCVFFRKANITIVIVAQAAKNPKAESSELRNRYPRLITVPIAS
jgi:hypothetical protein